MNKKFFEIYEKYKNDIYRLAISYTKNKNDSEDIVQNTFLKYYKNIDKIENDKIKNWLIKVAINECKNLFFKSWYKKVRFFKEDEEQSIPSYKNKKIEEIFNLPKKYRIVIHLYYYENYNVKEISEKLKISESNVKQRLHRARIILREEMEESK